MAAIARYKWIDQVRFLKADATEPLDESIGIPDHWDAVVVGSTFPQLLAELKPPQTVAIRLVKLEGYTFVCPSDDPLYIAVWYTAGCSTAAAPARAVLIHLLRW